MKAELIPENGDAPIPIRRDISVVGRKDFCDVVLEHPTISKRHCILVRTAGLLILRDLGTTNGTKVKGQRVRWAALLPNDRISIGGYKLRVYLGPDHIPSPSEAVAQAPMLQASFPDPTPPVLARPTLPAPAPASRPASPAIKLGEEDLVVDDVLDRMSFPSGANDPFLIDLD
jgi:predicted component of type VI protein secretion system